MRKRYVMRYVYAGGKWFEEKFPWEEAVRRIEERLRKDKKMLDILEKL